MRLTTQVATEPSATPTRVPTPNWSRKSRASPAAESAVPVIRAMLPTVRKMAIGSLEPLSTSRVSASRRDSRRPLVRRMENTAAASVEPTIAPRSRPCRSGMSSTRVAATPVRAEVSTTPRVARLRAGRQTERTEWIEVRRPPSNRMSARAALPMLLARG